MEEHDEMRQEEFVLEKNPNEASILSKKLSLKHTRKTKTSKKTSFVKKEVWFAS